MRHRIANIVFSVLGAGALSMAMATAQPVLGTAERLADLMRQIAVIDDRAGGTVHGADLVRLAATAPNNKRPEARIAYLQAIYGLGGISDQSRIYLCGMKKVTAIPQTSDTCDALMLLRGPVEELTLDVTTGDALTILGQDTSASVRVIKRDGLRIGYLHGWTMLTRPEAGGPADELRFALHGTFAGGDAVILDARGRIGGGMDVMEVFFAPRITLYGRGRADAEWSKPKGMAEAVRQQRLGLLVGARTAGAVTGGSFFALPDGGGLYLAVANLRVGGQRLEGNGVAPDVFVPFDLRDAQGCDPQLERAVVEAVRLARQAKLNGTSQ